MSGFATGKKRQCGAAAGALGDCGFFRIPLLGRSRLSEVDAKIHGHGQTSNAAETRSNKQHSRTYASRLLHTYGDCDWCSKKLALLLTEAVICDARHPA